MSALPVIANTFRVALDWRESGTGQTATNVIHVSGDSLTASDVAANVQAALTADMWTPVCSTATINEISVTPLDGSSATFSETPTGGHITGAADPPFNPAVSPVVTFYTDTRGRSFRGRLYLPFCSTSSAEDGLLDSGVAADLITGFGAFAAALTTDSMTHVVASYKLAEATPVTNYSVRAGYGTQRRRQERVRYP